MAHLWHPATLPITFVRDYPVSKMLRNMPFSFVVVMFVLPAAIIGAAIVLARLTRERRD